MHGNLELRLCCDAKLTLVSVDNEGRRLAVPPVRAESATERDRFAKAAQSRELRVKRRKQSVFGAVDFGGAGGQGTALL